MLVPPRIAALPRFPLLAGPSPLQRLERFSVAVDRSADVWIKREDLLPLAFGGNKLRNLELLVGAAIAEGADSLVTSGRRWSNHCRLTAAAGATAGLDVHLVLTGPPRPAAAAGPNQMIEELLGATVHVTATADRADRAAMVERVANDLRAAGRRPFVIGIGGTGPIGAAGQVLAGLELADQLDAAGIDQATVVLASATGGTHAGLLTAAGLGMGGTRLRADSGLAADDRRAGATAGAAVGAVVGIAVSAPAAELRPTIAALLEGLAPLAGVEVDPGRIVLDDEQLGEGYGRATPAAEKATRLLARTEGILVDPIYTAKALAGLIAGVRAGSLGGPIVFWHAGGTPGLFESLD